MFMGMFQKFLRFIFKALPPHWKGNRSNVLFERSKLKGKEKTYKYGKEKKLAESLREEHYVFKSVKIKEKSLAHHHNS